MSWLTHQNQSFSIKSVRRSGCGTRTEETYVHWIKRFIFFHDKRHPQEMAEAEIARFLSSLANDSHVSASTQNQALNAILFLYRQVLRKEIGYVNGVIRAKRTKRLPVVLTRQEVRSVLGCLDGSKWIMAVLLYGAGLRLMECLRLRVKDIDFTGNEIVVRAGKGDKDRHTILLGHKDVSTTMIYTHVLNRGGWGVNSPADRL